MSFKFKRVGRSSSLNVVFSYEGQPYSHVKKRCFAFLFALAWAWASFLAFHAKTPQVPRCYVLSMAKPPKLEVATKTRPNKRKVDSNVFRHSAVRPATPVV